MIPQVNPESQVENWQQQLAQAITNPETLLQQLQLPESFLEAAKHAAKLFPLRVPQSFVARMQLGNVHDPLLQQVLPIGKELVITNGYTADPLKESDANPIPGLLHKYHGRVLMILSGACAINCRYCFRRSFPYQDNNPGQQGWQAALDYIRNDESITEVIFSGGDPLVVKDKPLGNLIAELESIAHLKRLRIHSRLPIVLPARITDELADLLQQTTLQTIMVTHCNHAQEINHDVAAAIKKLTARHITVLNQSVLLKGINDSVAALVELSEALFAHKVLPYYLHLLDKVQGAAHFDVDITTAKILHQSICHQLPGFLVPKLVTEIAGEAAKHLIIT